MPCSRIQVAPALRGGLGLGLRVGSQRGPGGVCQCGCAFACVEPCLLSRARGTAVASGSVVSRHSAAAVLDCSSWGSIHASFRVTGSECARASAAAAAAMSHAASGRLRLGVKSQDDARRRPVKMAISGRRWQLAVSKTDRRPCWAPLRPRRASRVSQQVRLAFQQLYTSGLKLTPELIEGP